MPWPREKEEEKDYMYSYPEPAQVPLGEKPRVWGSNLAKGIRQNSPVPSEEGIPAIVLLVNAITGRSD